MDKEPLDKLSESAIWKDINLAEAYINNQYKVLPRLGWSDFVRSYQMSVFTDEATHKYNYHGLPSYRVGGMDPSTPTGLDVWSHHYNFIHGCNTFLANADNISVTSINEEEKISRLTGEAYALRAWSYIDLAARYGGVVLVTEPFQLSDDFKKERASFEETVDLIVSDLDQAASLLPMHNADDKDWGRMTKGAALALKSRILLYAASPLFNEGNNPEKWKLAANAAKAVMDLGAYELYGNESNYKDIFLTSKNSEVILSKGHDPVVDDGDFSYFQVVEGLGGGTDGNGYANGWSTTMVSQNLVDAFEFKDGTPFDWNNPQHTSNPYENRDPRLYASVTIDGSPWIDNVPVQFWVTEKDNKFNLPVYDNDNFSTPNPDFMMDNLLYGRNSQANPVKRGDAPQLNYIYRKSMDNNYNIQEESIPFSVPWIIIRYSEVVLNYAEASFEAGDEGNALMYLNSIRNRVGMPNVNASGSKLREAIRHERQVELCLEGHRYFDARRWEIAEDVFSKPIYGISIVKDKNSDKKVYRKFKYEERQFPSMYYLQPIPLAEIQRSAIAQNPGY